MIMNVFNNSNLPVGKAELEGVCRGEKTTASFAGDCTKNRKQIILLTRLRFVVLSFDNPIPIDFAVAASEQTNLND